MRLSQKTGRGREGDWIGRESHTEGRRGQEYAQEGWEDWEVHQ